MANLSVTLPDTQSAWGVPIMGVSSSVVEQAGASDGQTTAVAAAAADEPARPSYYQEPPKKPVLQQFMEVFGIDPNSYLPDIDLVEVVYGNRRGSAANAMLPGVTGDLVDPATNTINLDNINTAPTFAFAQDIGVGDFDGYTQGLLQEMGFAPNFADNAAGAATLDDDEDMEQAWDSYYDAVTRLENKEINVNAPFEEGAIEPVIEIHLKKHSGKKNKSHNAHKSTHQTKKKTAGKGDIKDKLATMDVLAATNDGQGSKDLVDQKPSKVTKKKSSKKPKRNLSTKERLELYEEVQRQYEERVKAFPAKVGRNKSLSSRSKSSSPRAKSASPKTVAA